MLFTKARVLPIAILMVAAGSSMAQYPTSCADVGSRANSNGQASSCANVSGTLYAVNFVGTSYATVPALAKTGNLQLKYGGASLSLKPFAITRVWLTNPATTLLSVPFGPAGVPAVSGTDIVVNYCFYGNNLPPAGTLSLELTNPETGVVSGICSYDASCSANCTVVANPPVLLPVVLSGFVATEKDETVQLSWVCNQEINNKGFVIERSVNGVAFNDIGFVASRSSSVPVKYAFTDTHLPAATTALYRIRQLDLDGTSAYTQVLTVVLTKNKSAVNIYGHEHSITIAFPAAGLLAAYNVTVYDLQGKMIEHKEIKAVKEYTITNLKGNSHYCVYVTGQTALEKYTQAVYLF
jgi:hypothetical protein